jgi:1,2-phenylacetyl-CoA epoxidase PaaB subunit
MTVKKQKPEYLLFTRIKRGDDLIQVGSFLAENDELARIYAQYIYDEEDWVEMQVVRKDAFITVRLPEPLFEKEGVN